MKAATIGIALAVGCATTALAGERAAPAQFDGVIAKHAAANGVPETLIRRVIVRESRYNPRARNGRYYGMMQIAPATARSMGYRGDPSGLLDADVNLTYAVRYLAGAYRVAGGNHDRAVGLYARGYYYDAKRRGMLAAIGMGRNGKLTPPALAAGQAAPALAAAPQDSSPSARTQLAFSTFGGSAPAPFPAPAAPRGAVAYAAGSVSPAVPFPPSRGAAPARPQVASVAVPTPPVRTIDPKAQGGPVLASVIPTPQPRDVVTTGSIAENRPPRASIFGRTAPQPASTVVAAVAPPQSAAGPQIPLPAPRDAAPAVATRSSPKPPTSGPRTIAPGSAPVLASSIPAIPLPPTLGFKGAARPSADVRTPPLPPRR